MYNATGFDLPKEDGWELLGQVISVNNLEWPAEDFIGTHLNVGQEIYWKPSEPQKLYVKYDSGFALFEAEETISYGEAFAIEVLHDGVWEKLPVLLENYEFDKGVIV